ncbi:MAG TPA: carbonic anhydrase, partial [Thermoanaerobaculia bacterium]|nr:carbonic anhydrase [Thermoanaerobaculia bacterium]
MEGNRAYVAGRLTYDNLVQSREKTANGQNPPVTVLSCADSRVPPELIFDRSIDQLFVIRAAGNIAGRLGIASIEYAIANGWTKMIVVLAHGECGAVKAALERADPPSPNLVFLVQRIRQSFDSIERNPKDLTTVRRATEANARASA